MLPASFSEVSQLPGSNSIYTAASLGTGLPSKNVRESAFFLSPFNALSWSTSGDALSGLSCGGVALQYTDE